ncbi:MAG: IPT/TIG domain-containing protein [Woeseiaceae bacterium]|nr:IPT/TIG domain-containing protein [Woeseiaceae bacterium]
MQAEAQFVDDFERPDSAILGNGWLEKTPGTFDLNTGQAQKNFIVSDYRDNIVYRPASENALDVEASIEFQLSGGSPGYPQIFTRVQQDTVALDLTVDGYILYINDSNTIATVGRQRGSAFLTELALIDIFPALNTNDTFRLRLRTTGTASVLVEAFVERWTGSDWQVIGQAVIVDGGAARIDTAGAVGFGGYIESSYNYDNFRYTNLGGATNPAPSLGAINPTSATEGSAGFNLTISGSGFIDGSIVRWNGTDRATTFVSGNELQAAISAADVATAGSANVTVFTPLPGGGTSAAQTFTIDPAAADNPVPVLSAVDPSVVIEGSGDFTLTANGSGFVAGSIVRWNGSDRATTYVSNSQLTALITAADIANAGTATVTVFSPLPGGGISGAQTVTINPPVADNPVPVLNVLEPSAATEGSPGITLTVDGNSFVAGSVVRWNGTDRPTTFVTANMLTATIPASDLAAAGTVPVTVFSPTPGGGTSVPQNFVINPSADNPIPNLTAIAPGSIAAGSAAFSLTVTGSDFVPASTVRWNGTDRTTTYVSANELQATVTAADVASTGASSVTVFTPGPGGGTSTEAAFLVLGGGGENGLSIVDLSPESAVTGSGPVTVTIIGENFDTSSTANLNGAPLTTTFISPQQLEVTIGSGDLAAAAVGTIVVTSPTGGSNPYPFLVVEPNNSYFLDNFNTGDSPNIGNNWTEKNPEAFEIRNNAVTGVATDEVYRDNIVYRPASEDRRDVELSFEFVRQPGFNFAQLHARATRATIGVEDLLESYILYVEDYLTPNSGLAFAIGPDLVTTGECIIDLFPFSAPLQPGERYRLRFRVTGANPVRLDGFLDWFDGTTWQSLMAQTVIHDDNSQPDPFYCGPGFMPPPLQSAGAIGFSKWADAPEEYDNFYWMDISTSAPAPVVATLSPGSATAGSGAFTLLVNGSEFVPSSTVRWNGSDRPTTYVSSTTLQANISAADIANPTVAQVSVSTPAPGGGISANVGFQVVDGGQQPNPAPQVQFVAPTSALAGTGPLQLTVTGTGFAQDSVVRWNGANRPTTYVSGSSLVATISAADLAAAGTAALTVWSPSPGGGTSSAASFEILDTGDFFDDFNRGDNAGLGNGWTEKSPQSFSIVDQALAKQYVGSGYLDNIAYRPAAESMQNGETSVEFEVTSPQPGYPQIFTRVQLSTVGLSQVIDGYILYLDNSLNFAVLGRNNGSNFVTPLAMFTLDEAIQVGERYRMQLSATGTGSVALQASFERLTESGYMEIGSASAVDASAERIAGPGVAGVGGYVEATYLYDNFRATDLD